MKPEEQYEDETKMVNVQCPICEKGTLEKGTIKEIMQGVNLGEFPAEICSSCGESFTDPETTRKIEAKAKEKGIWGLGKMTKIAKAGNSLVVRIPKKIAEKLKLKVGEEAYIHIEERKLIIEPK